MHSGGEDNATIRIIYIVNCFCSTFAIYIDENGVEVAERARCKPKVNRSFLPVKATYLFYIGALVTLFPVIPVYLSYLGLSPSQIGLIRGAEPFLDFFVSPVWGSVADKFSMHKTLVLINVCGVGGAYFSTIFVPGSGEFNSSVPDGAGSTDTLEESSSDHWTRTRGTFTFCLILIACGQMFNAGVVPLMDANTEEMTKHHKGSSYGRQRLWGSMGGMIFSVSAGAIMDLYSDHPFFLHEYSPAYVIFFFFIILTSSLFGILTLPRTHHPRQCSETQEGFLRIHASKQIIWKIGHENAFLLVLAAYAIRFLAYSFLWNPWWILPVELLHGFCFGILWPNVTAFCNAVAPPGMAATMQSLAFALTAGLSEGIGTILGGLFYERYGARNLFRTMAAACLCILIAYKIFCCFFEPIKPGSGGKPTETSNEPAVREAEEGQNQPQN
ncbi:putative major facilitator superfamily domain-containing protein 6-B [Apostichopus japonicus]|uniref:Putative major facilitator superfamily domain-containing protein 6-B n=1 Tax=Stichopus japonicus TaxID=307972 RepID=A0A2G8LC16_STIJA|nr:putative major facilitator superfamily domain-containing protein 6-B [Apostichopus japonicus]